MKYTSSEASKLLRTLNENHGNLLRKESQRMTFMITSNEDAEAVRPQYDYAAFREELARLENRIRKVKHAINRFNVSTGVPGFDMTIDQILVYIPQLSARKRKLEEMIRRLPRQREWVTGHGSNHVVEYSCVNYDMDQAEADYREASEELTRAQTALDLINNTEKMEIDIDL